MSSQIPPLVCHTPPPIDFDTVDDDDEYGSDIPEDDGIANDDCNESTCPDDDFGEFTTVLPRGTTVEPNATEAVIDNETENLTSIPASAETKGVFPTRLGSDSPPSLILPPNEYTEGDGDETVAEREEDEDEDIDYQPFGCPSQPPEPPPEDSISLPSLHFDADVSKSEEDDNVPVQPNPASSMSGSGVPETEVDHLAAAAAERTTPVIQEGGRFDDNTENDFTDFTTASNERSSVVLEIPTANDVSFELDDFAQLESTPSADSNFVSQQSRTDFATFDADFSKFDSFQASFPVALDEAAQAKTPIDESKALPPIEQTPVKQLTEPQIPDDDFDDFQEFATFSEQPTATISSQPSVSANRIDMEPTLQASTIAMDDGKKYVQSSTETADGDSEDDDFGEFSDFKQPETVNNTFTPICSFSMENVQNLLELMFPYNASEPLATDTGQRTDGDNIPSNTLHSQLQDFDNTCALTYQYSKSSSSKTLVTALGIDSRNIMHGPKWNSSMPRFAANLSFDPLEPLKPTVPTSKEASANVNEKNTNFATIGKPATLTSSGLEALQTSVVAGSSVPAAQFDWNSSGLVNPLEASHAHTLLLDLEQLEVMASLKDKINVDSSSYSPALRSTRNVANTVQLHSPTTTATTVITSTTPLLLPSPPSPTLPQLPRPPPSPPLPTTTTTTKLLSSSSLLSTTMNTQTCIRLHNANAMHPPQTQPGCLKPTGPADNTADGTLTARSMDCSTALLVFSDENDDDRNLLISTTTILPSALVKTAANSATTPPLIDSPLDEFFPLDASCPYGIGMQLIGFDADNAVQSITKPIPSDRLQSFDDYLDISVQEMLQKATVGQPEDGPKGEVLDSQISENPSPIAADDIAVVRSSIVTPSAVPSRVLEDEDVGSLDFASGNSSIIPDAAVLPSTIPEHQQQQVGPPQSHPYASLQQTQHPQQQQQQLSMSISSSPNSVPVVRTIKLPETHIFTPSRGVTPVSRDITDRDIVVREYHDVEYSLEKSRGAAASKSDPDLEEFNDFQSVFDHPPVAPASSVAIDSHSSIRPVIGRSPTEELEQRMQDGLGHASNGRTVECVDTNEDDDFSDFQAAIPSATVVQPVNKPVSNVQSNRSNTNSPVMLLSPAILLPQQANAPMEKDSPTSCKNAPAALINWPEPGIDPDEMARFEAAFAKPAAQSSSPATTIAASNQSVQVVSKAPAVEEDEWTDFISSKPVAVNEASIPPAGSTQAAPELASGTQEEWTDFISSSSTSGASGGFTSHHNRLSSSQNNFNFPGAPSAGRGYSSSGTKAPSTWSNQPQMPPPQFNSWNSNSLYYNPMAALPLTAQRPSAQYVPPRQQHFYNRSEIPVTAFASGAGFSGVPKVPTNPQHHHASAGPGGGPMMMGQQPAMQLLPELSFITPNVAGHGGGTPGAKPATHSFLSNVISSNTFTKK